MKVQRDSDMQVTVNKKLFLVVLSLITTIHS